MDGITPHEPSYLGHIPHLNRSFRTLGGGWAASNRPAWREMYLQK